MSQNSSSEARAHLDWIKEKIQEYEKNGNTGVEDEMRDSVLGICVRSGWTPINEKLEAREFQILLSTGGPACAIFGTMSESGVDDVEIKHQDWGEEWQRLPMTEEESEALVRFASLILCV